MDTTDMGRAKFGHLKDNGSRNPTYRSCEQNPLPQRPAGHPFPSDEPHSPITQLAAASLVLKPQSQSVQKRRHHLTPRLLRNPAEDQDTKKISKSTVSHLKVKGSSTARAKKSAHLSRSKRPRMKGQSTDPHEVECVGFSLLGSSSID